VLPSTADADSAPACSRACAPGRGNGYPALTLSTFRDVP